MTIKAKYNHILDECIETISNCSIDSSNQVSLVDDINEVINFDNVTKKYSELNFINHNVPQSLDSLYINDNLCEIFFIEFKNKKKIDKVDIKNKIYGSVYILMDIFDLTTDFIRANVKFILVYKVPKELSASRYVLYYPDVTNGVLLRKVKLGVQDVSELETASKVKITEKLTFPDDNTLTVTDYNISNETTYSRYSCDDYGCGIRELPLTSSNKILEIAFSSNNLTGESFVDFSSIYAKIRYEDNNGKMHSIIPRSLVNSYNGNYAYFSLPNDANNDGEVDLIFTFRNKQYIYKLN